MKKKKHSQPKKMPVSNISWNLLLLAWLLSVVATLGAIFIGEIMGKVPCNMCWYQRIFMFPLPVILGIAVYREDFSIWRYTLPLAFLGAGFSAFHSLLFFKILPEEVKPCMAEGPSCSGADMMLWGYLPLPLLSLVAFVLIMIMLFLIKVRK